MRYRMKTSILVLNSAAIWALVVMLAGRAAPAELLKVTLTAAVITLDRHIKIVIHKLPLKNF